MPTARKTAVKKTTARRPTATDEAEARLKAYKTLVADKVKHYRENGDLCQDEYNQLREELGLEAFLTVSTRLHLEIIGGLIIEGDDSVDAHNHYLAAAIGNHLHKLLKEGIEVEYNEWRMGREVQHKVKVKFDADSELEDYSLEEYDRRY